VANALALETSPYLLQHAENPVDWRPWGPQALDLARERDVPILLSIGYSSCHWCHVMERESFEDPGIAALMNERFVPIKVDREERPDVDAIYMEAVQAMTGHGGWPLTAFLDSDAVPFYCGTYFPPEPRHGMPSFRMVLEAVAESWATKRDDISEQAGRVRARLAAAGEVVPSDVPDADALDRAVELLRQAADPVNGGFGGAPKFPPASAIEFLLARGETGVPARALDSMMAGGIHDQLGGGFARYSVDGQWLVPHFEKMLYDSALLARAYLHGYQALGHDRWREATQSTLDWMLREMRGPEGGFLTALDADSEGEEGRFYVWTEEEIRSVLSDAELGEHADELLAFWGVDAGPNFEGKSILHRPAGADSPAPEGLAEARDALLERRSKRVWPGIDDKRLTSQNALAIAALADAGAVLGRSDYVEAAVRAAEFVESELRGRDGKLLRTWKAGEAKLDGYLEDHAYLLDAYLVLYEATFDPRWFIAARTTGDAMIERFADGAHGGFFTTAADAAKLIVRRKDVDDHPAPSGNSAAAYALFRLAALTGEHRYAAHAESVLALFGRVAERHPHAVAHLLRALDFHHARIREVALAGPEPEPFAAVVRNTLRPHVVLAGGPGGTQEPPLMQAREPVAGRTAAYVCEGFSCQAPVTDPDELAAALGE
jgi:uncharacterized protein YyaL (SSP411 family)